ncbi:MAG: Rpn family recombination-promoting nuclease/putative transposase [Pseudomonadota bacterium]
MTKLIHNPHDKSFRQAMSDPRVAREVIDQGLTADQKALIDFQTMHIEKDTFVDEDYRYELSDLVYRVKLKTDGMGYIYLLCEHLSQAKALMPFYLLSYQIKIMKAHLKKDYKKLPLVFPIVLYHGRSPYNEPTDLYACFDHPALARKYFLKPHGLIDLTRMADEDILKYKWASVMELIFKHVFARDVLPVFEKLAQTGIFQKLVKEDGSHYVLDMVYYTIKAAEVSDPERFKQLFENTEEIRGEIMTIAQQLEQRGIEKGMRQGMQQGMQRGIEQGVQQGIERGVQQGMQQGIEQGVQQGRAEYAYETARRMLADNERLEKIARYTGLSLDEIKTLC